MARKKSDTEQQEEKDEILDLIGIRASILKQFGHGTSVLADELQIGKTTSSGSIGLDIALGLPFPRGIWIEIFGPNGTGKTTIALSALANAQKQGRAAFFIDAEHRLQKSLLETIPDLNLKQLEILKPGSGEQALDMCLHLMSTVDEAFIVVDSIASLVSEVELEADMTNLQMGSLARMMSKFARKGIALTESTGANIIFLNQVRATMNMYGKPSAPPGGSAIPFLASQRIELMDIVKDNKILDENNKQIGHWVRTINVKNSCAMPYVKAEVPIIYGKGVDNAREILKYGEEYGIIDGSSKGWFNINDQKLHGEPAALEYLKSNPKVMEELKAKIHEICA